MKYSPDKEREGYEFVLLSIGSNIGDKAARIENAYEFLITSGVLHDAVMSSLYETEPVGILDQDWFLNAVIAGYTDLEPNQLLKSVKDIEYGCGREARQRWHEREMDIDILLYGSLVLQEKNLVIPHTRMHKRRFVLVPANEICPNAVHPIKKMTISELLDECPDQSEIRIY